MPLTLETSQITITLSGKEWAALCVRFLLEKDISEQSTATANLAQIKIIQSIYNAARTQTTGHDAQEMRK